MGAKDLRRPFNFDFLDYILPQKRETLLPTTASLKPVTKAPIPIVGKETYVKAPVDVSRQFPPAPPATVRNIRSGPRTLAQPETPKVAASAPRPQEVPDSLVLTRLPGDEIEKTAIILEGGMINKPIYGIIDIRTKGISSYLGAFLTSLSTGHVAAGGSIGSVGKGVFEIRPNGYDQRLVGASEPFYQGLLRLMPREDAISTDREHNPEGDKSLVVFNHFASKHHRIARVATEAARGR